MPVSHSSDLIALVGLTWNARSYDPGDKFEPKILPHQRRTIDRMVNAASRKLGELTAANMAIALERRPREAGVPAGFTLAGLRGLNLVTEEQVARFGWDGAAGEQDPETGIVKLEEKTVRPAWLDEKTEAYAVEDLWVVRQKSNGGPPRYDVLDAKGDRVFTGGTIAGKDNAIKKAQAFIDARPPAEETKDDTLMGSSKLAAIIEIAGHQIQLGGIVAAAFEDFSAGAEGVENPVAAWNDLPEDGEGGREERLQAMIDLLAEDPEQIAKRVPETSIVARPDAEQHGDNGDDLDALRTVAEADVENMDVAALKVWLADRDMHGLDDVTEDDLRTGAVKIRDAAAEKVKAADAQTSEGNEDGGDVQPGSEQGA